MKIDFDLIKKIRKETNAPLKDCKEVLIESCWDYELALKKLKEKWLSKAIKKSDRDVNEWLTFWKSSNWEFVWIKLWCETDFVAKNETFLEIWNKIVDLVFKYPESINSITEISWTELEKNVNDLVISWVSVIWENIKLLDVFKIKWNWYLYIHPWSKILSCVFFENIDSLSNIDFFKDIALQIAAMNPKFLSVEKIDNEFIANFKNEILQELSNLDKSIEVKEKIVEWRLRKVYDEIVLLEQFSIKDEKIKVKNLLPKWVNILKYIRYSF